MKDMGIHPTFGIILGILLFFGLSKVLFFKTEYAIWIYPVILISVLFRLSGVERNNELQNIFSGKKYLSLRIGENLLLSVPFHVYLVFEMEFLVLLLTFPIAIGFTFIKSKRLWNRTIPTPFKKFPFEFIVGFRKTIWFIIIAYFLIGKAIQVDNFNLALFGLGLVFLICMSYYRLPEPSHFVWIYSYRTKNFLRKKFMTSVICVSILLVFGLLSVFIAFPQNWYITLAVYLGGYVLLGSIIVAKYSAYPNEMNIPQGIFYAISLMFPPMLLIAMWIFYSQSKKRLDPILEC